jgi:hypothetical protein
VVAVRVWAGLKAREVDPSGGARRTRSGLPLVCCLQYARPAPASLDLMGEVLQASPPRELGGCALCVDLDGAGSSQCGALPACARRLLVASSPSIGLLRLHRLASPWPADGSHGRGLAPHEGCSQGRFLEVKASPYSRCQSRRVLARRAGMLHGHAEAAMVPLPPTQEGYGLVGGRPPLSGGVHPAADPCQSWVMQAWEVVCRAAMLVGVPLAL